MTGSDGARSGHQRFQGRDQVQVVAELVGAARRLHQVCTTRLTTELGRRGLPLALDIAVDAACPPTAVRLGVDAIGKPWGWITMTATAHHAPGGAVATSYVVAVSTVRGAPELVVAPCDGGEPLRVWLRLIHPCETSALTTLVDAWAAGAVGAFVRSIESAAERRS